MKSSFTPPKVSLILSQQRALMLCHKPAYEILEVSNCEVSWRATAEVSTVHAPLFLSEVWWGKVTTTKKICSNAMLVENGKTCCMYLVVVSNHLTSTKYIW